jgi:hypothetical protein
VDVESGGYMELGIWIFENKSVNRELKNSSIIIIKPDYPFIQSLQTHSICQDRVRLAGRV